MGMEDAVDILWNDRVRREFFEPAHAATVVPDVALVRELREKLRLRELQCLEINYKHPDREALLADLATYRKQLHGLTGDAYGRPPAKGKARPVPPADELLEAEYLCPEDVPQEVMAWVLKHNSLLTSDATDAVRFSRIVDTLGDDRYPAGSMTIYRAVEDGDDIRAGDWVTTDRAYAEEHLQRWLGGRGGIIEEDVDGADVLISPTGNHEEAIYAPRDLSGPVTYPSKTPGLPLQAGSVRQHEDIALYMRRALLLASRFMDAALSPSAPLHAVSRTIKANLEGKRFPVKVVPAESNMTSPAYCALRLAHDAILDADTTPAPVPLINELRQAMAASLLGLEAASLSGRKLMHAVDTRGVVVAPCLVATVAGETDDVGCVTWFDSLVPINLNPQWALRDGL